MKVSEQVLNRIKSTTRRSFDQVNLLRSEARTVTEKLQLILDFSTFDCNKSLVVDLFAVITEHPTVDWKRLEIDSHRKRELVYEPGTFVRVDHHNAGHNYSIDSFALIVRTIKRKQHAGIRHDMIGLRQDGTEGNDISVLNPFLPAVQPWILQTDIERFIEALPETLEATLFMNRLEEQNV